ncbi:MAG TPA: VWA domain-containing protein, partial [Candidatus Paenibacillus intestinavium]|nr:VWA domain-containing protein [Candidatus Paenibacillus intestinavium]
MANKGKAFTILIVITIIVFGLVYLGVTLTSNLGKTSMEVSEEDADKKLDKLYKNINVTSAEPIKGQVDLDPVAIGDSLPDISKFPVSVENTTDSYIEIFSSTEKSGTGIDGWL